MTDANEPSESRRTRGALAIALASGSWGTWSLFFRPAEAKGGVNAALEVTVIYTTILLFTAPLALRDRPRARRPTSAFLWLGAQGVFDATNGLLFFWAMQTTTLAVAVLTHYLAPVLVALSAPWVLGEKSDRRTIAALVVAFTGLVVLLEPWRGGGSAVGLGALLGGGSALFFTASLLVAKRLQRHFAPTEIWPGTCRPGSPSACRSFPRASPTPSRRPRALAARRARSGALAGVLFIRGLAHTEANRASILMLLEPVVAVVVGVVVWNEVPRPLVWAGAALVLGAAWLVLTTPRAPGARGLSGGGASLPRA
ncbi:MAG: DMT family transporter [Polyangiaceae bacterium]